VLVIGPMILRFDLKLPNAAILEAAGFSLHLIE
jgi:hypothetical protein